MYVYAIHDNVIEIMLKLSKLYMDEMKGRDIK